MWLYAILYLSEFIIRKVTDDVERDFVHCRFHPLSQRNNIIVR